MRRRAVLASWVVIAAIISALPCPLGAQEGEPAADGGDVGALSAWEGAQAAGAAGEVNAPVDVALAGEAVEADEVEPEDLTAGGRVLITAVGDVALTTNAFKPVIDKLNHQIFCVRTAGGGPAFLPGAGTGSSFAG